MRSGMLGIGRLIKSNLRFEIIGIFRTKVGVQNPISFPEFLIENPTDFLIHLLVTRECKDFFP